MIKCFCSFKTTKEVSIIQYIETLFVFVGGIGMFLYGMTVMADGLQQTYGDKMKVWLGSLTKNKWMSIGLGALITALLQSSSATTVMVVGFVNASILSLNQAVGIIMGANIGTTITAWIVSMGEWANALNPEFFSPLLVAVGAFMVLFAKNEKTKETASIFLGFGFLFVGLTFMGSSIKAYSDSPVFSNAFIVLGKYPLLAILVGMVVTGIIQSSSASVGILQTLAMSGVVSTSGAIFITLGQNIGTTVTSMISSVGSNRTAKRAASIHLLFNVFGAVIFGIFFMILFSFKPELGAKNINSVQISIFHTIFNVANTLLLLPFSNFLVKASGWIFKAEVEEDDTFHTRFINLNLVESPIISLHNANLEIKDMSALALENLRLSIESLFKSKDNRELVYENEQRINAYTKVLNEYLIKINNLSLNLSQSAAVNSLYNTISDIERIGDHAENLQELADLKVKENIRFSDAAYVELKEIAHKAYQSYEYAHKIIDTEDPTYLKTIETLEEEVDQLENKFRKNHLKRLTDGTCDIETGILYIDAIINLERISDHALNIAHEYIN
ncbi:MAG TPA: Na/Pi cotransporter family protein [Erysipelothrix sp.]|nr:Na/Pi cotransporter family protein [Erysipelothrix sp.]